MPQLVERLLHQPVGFVNRGPRLILGGSILNWADKHCTVWGAGLADIEHRVHPHARILAVRGPLSRQRAIDCGAVAPEVYGDPALLMPRVFPRTKQPQHKLGLVPHYIHYELMKKQYGDTLPVIDVKMPVERVLEALWSCHAVVSTSLHGLILADAYEVESGWAEVPTIPLGGDVHRTKFHDYFLSIGKREMERTMVPLLLTEDALNQRSTLCARCVTHSRCPRLTLTSCATHLTRQPHDAQRFSVDTTTVARRS
jgi:hypothetical protein